MGVCTAPCLLLTPFGFATPILSSLSLISLKLCFFSLTLLLLLLGCPLLLLLPGRPLLLLPSLVSLLNLLGPLTRRVVAGLG